MVLRWVVIWLLLLLAAVTYLGIRGWRLWGKTKAFAAELSTTERQLADLQSKIELLDDRIQRPEHLAVFDDPFRVSAERTVLRREARLARAERRRRSRPGWARRMNLD